MTLFIYSMVILLTILLVKVVEENYLKHGNMIPNYIQVIITLPASILSGIRYGIGTDYFVRYYPDFMILKENICANTKVEAGFEMISRIIIALGGNFQIMLFVVAFITIFISFKSIYYYYKEINVAYGVFVYMLLFYLSSFNIVRQSLAMAIVMFSLRYLHENKARFKYTVLIIIASTIHTSAFIFIPIGMLIKYKRRGKWKGILIYGLFLLIILVGPKLLYEIIARSSFSYYATYFKDTNTGEGISVYFIFKWILMLLPIFISKYRNIPLSTEMNIYKNMLILSAIIAMGAYFGSSTLMNRMSMYLKVSAAIMIPYWIKNISIINMILGRVKIKMYWLIMSSALIVIWYYEYFIRGDSQVVPYMNFFQSIN